MDWDLGSVVILFVIVIGMGTLLYRVVKRGGRGEATISVAQLFTANIKLETALDDRTKATKAIRSAAQERGEVIEQVAVPEDSTRFARILWVDDQPDNNLLETVALESLGRFVTHTTSTRAGLRYLAELNYSLAVTDIGRHGDPKAGIEFLHRVRRKYPQLPLIVYTLNAHIVAEEAIAAGADAVVDQPDELLRYVEAYIAASFTQSSFAR
ncbi:response regulator [Kribbella speibonae]|uniref:Response regulator n=1 Tax=Kribbella speibonae TaxID=1572660 RepID=A0ABY2A812_9ACTN|nr:response regulator [Kribbella speibonae]TCC25222.1 response regulator [Kribbella speibonae]